MLTTKTIGKRIADARKKMNLSQAELARHAFLSAQAIGKWERGESLPDIITLSNLTKVLGVDLNYFSGNTEQITSEEEPVEFSVKELATSVSENKVQKLKWNMSRGNWVDADFSGLKNLNEKFSSSNMQRCKFIDSDLSGLLLRSNHVDLCDFRGSDFRGARIQNSHLAGTLFNDCFLQETEFSGSYISGCNFTGTDLTGVVVRSGGLEKNIFTATVLNQTSFIDMHIADIVFDGAIENCSFENCSFKKVIFQNAMLINTFFKNNNLKKVLFIDCKVDRITYEFLKSGKADLTGVTIVM